MDMRSILSAAAAVVALVVGAWYFGYFADSRYSSDPQVAELQRFRDENIRLGRADSEAARDEFRQRIEQLSDEQRREFFMSGMSSFAPMMERRMDEFFALPPEKQIEQLDREIDAMEQMRKQMEAGGGPGLRGGPGRGPFGPNASPAEFNEMRKRMLDNTTPELRSKFERRMTMMNDRRKERGLPAFGP